ncbi:MAG: ParB/RepB/Spo0J family partition protein [Alphaproteobacteria bacterium]|nr:ParB/RepB/Spo0J family partition protein [Alphaproteobacteria bacterium]
MCAKEVSPRLGRGLAALLGEAAAAAAPSGGGSSVTAAIDLFEPSPYQPRGSMDATALDELTESIRARGVLQPILARPHPEKPGHYQIIAGERRWRAAQRAGLHEIPVLVRPLSEAEAMAAALVENLQRQDLNALEEADGYRRLIDEFGLTQDALGTAVGKSRSHVANTLRLLNLPPAVQAAVHQGALSAGHARALLSHPDPALAALSVISRGLNVRQTEALAARRSEPKSERTSRARDPDTLALERSLTERLGLKVEIAFDGGGGSVRIRYRSLDQLDGLITLLSRD